MPCRPPRLPVRAEQRLPLPRARRLLPARSPRRSMHPMMPVPDRSELRPRPRPRPRSQLLRRHLSRYLPCRPTRQPTRQSNRPQTRQILQPLKLPALLRRQNLRCSPVRSLPRPRHRVRECLQPRRPLPGPSPRALCLRCSRPVRCSPLRRCGPVRVLRCGRSRELQDQSSASKRRALASRTLLTKTSMARSTSSGEGKVGASRMFLSSGSR